MTQPDQNDQLLLQASPQSQVAADTSLLADVQPADNKNERKNSSSCCQWKKQTIYW